MHATGRVYQYAIDRPDGFPHFQLLYCVRGSGGLEVCGKKYQVDKGHIIFLYPETPHRYFPIEEPWEICWIVFGGYQIKQIAGLIGLQNSDAYETSN